MIKLKPDKSTPENRSYWRFVQKTRHEVSSWPEWKRPRLAESKKRDLLE